MQKEKLVEAVGVCLTALPYSSGLSRAASASGLKEFLFCSDQVGQSPSK